MADVWLQAPDPPVGLVIGIDDATPLEFWVAVDPGATVQLDDVVAVDRVLPTGERVSIYGLVTQVRARHEGARFQSDVFLVDDGLLPAQVSEAVLVQPTRFEPEVLVPPLPGAPVRLAADADREIALSFDDVARRLPAGLSRSGEPVVVDLDFIDGTKGAHVNISGISGVATKTSYATFLLYSMFTSGVLGGEAANTRALIFNVKGEDLLFLDHANAALDDTQAARYRLLGLAPAPFRDVGILAPPRKGDPNATPATGSRHLGVRPFFWTVADFCRQQLLPFLFADAEDERQQYTIVIGAVTAQLAQLDDAGDGAVRLDGRTIRTFGQLVDAIEDKLLPAHPDEPADQRWTGRAVGVGTVNAFVRRLASARRHVEHLIRADIADAPGHRFDPDHHQVTVVDIHSLHDRAKRFVVGVVLRQAFDAKEASGVARPLQLVVLDELNKYAPGTRRARSRRSARRGRAGPVARHHPHRGPADGERSGAAGGGQLRHPHRRPPRPGRGPARRVRLPPAGPAPAGDDPQARIDVSGPAPTAGAAAGRVPVPGLGHPLGRGSARPRLQRRHGRRRCGPLRRPDVVKLLHTSDWHVGRTIRGHSRAGEHRAVLAEIAAIAATEGVDASLVAGDLFDSAAPHGGERGHRVRGAAGPGRGGTGVRDRREPRQSPPVGGGGAAAGAGSGVAGGDTPTPRRRGVVEIDVDGSLLRVAALPFVSQRGIVRADALMADAAFQHAQTYAARLHQVLAALCAGFDDGAVNIVVAHAFVAGGPPGAGSGPPTWWRSTPWPGPTCPPRRPTSPSATSTGRRWWRRRHRRTTAGRPCNSTSVRPGIPRWSSWWRPSRGCGPR